MTVVLLAEVACAVAGAVVGVAAAIAAVAQSRYHHRNVVALTATVMERGAIFDLPEALRQVRPEPGTVVTAKVLGWPRLRGRAAPRLTLTLSMADDISPRGMRTVPASRPVSDSNLS